MLEGLEISVLNLHEVLRDNTKLFRIEAEFFKNEYLTIEKKFQTSPSINSVNANITCGPFGSNLLDTLYKENGILVVRPFNLKNCKVENDNLVYISEQDLKNNNLKLFTKGTLLFSRVGDIKIGVLNKKSVTISPNIIAAEFENDEIAKFLCVFYHTKYGFTQIQRQLKISAQPTISTEIIGKLKFPITSVAFQSLISKLLDNSFEQEEISKQTYDKAETILLQEIGLGNFEPSKEPINIKSFKESFGTTKRLDAEYYQLKYEQIEALIKKKGYYTISEIFGLISNASPSSYTDNGTKVLKTKNIRIPTIEIEKLTDHTNEPKELIKKNDLLFASMGVGSLGRLSYIDKDYENCTTDGTIRIFRTKKEFKNLQLEIPCLLFLTSQFGQELIYKYVIGSTGIISISKENVENLIFPKIPITLAKQLTEIVLESIQLKAESERLLDVAKKAVEMAIEIDETTAIKFIKDNTK